MLALRRLDRKVCWAEVPEPTFSPHGRNCHDVLIRVRLVGLCRTDLAVADGQLPVQTPRILGHEFVGTVVAVGSEVMELETGDSVSANPVVSCGECDRCDSGRSNACAKRKFLGVDRDGAITELICLPARNVIAMSSPPEASLSAASSLDDREAAFLEPVAACAAVLNAPISQTQTGVISGNGRLAELTQQILRHAGFEHLCVLSSVPKTKSPLEFDFAIETEGTQTSLDVLLKLLRPGGILVLKSRPVVPLQLDVRSFLPLEIQLHAVDYACFGESRDLIVGRRLDLTPMLGDVWQPEDFERAFKTARNDEHQKQFLAVPTENSNAPRSAGSKTQCVA